MTTQGRASASGSGGANERRAGSCDAGAGDVRQVELGTALPALVTSNGGG
jgi:hypothetical protein